MLQVKGCDVKHNSESVFRCFASAVNSTGKDKSLYAVSVVIQALKKSVMFLCIESVLKRISLKKKNMRILLGNWQLFVVVRCTS